MKANPISWSPRLMVMKSLSCNNFHAVGIKTSFSLLFKSRMMSITSACFAKNSASWPDSKSCLLSEIASRTASSKVHMIFVGRSKP